MRGLVLMSALGRKRTLAADGRRPGSAVLPILHGNSKVLCSDRSNGERGGMRFLPLMAALAASFASPALAQSLKSNEVPSAIVVRPLAQPNPVLGADNRVHLVYELLVSNARKGFLTVDKVEAVDLSGKVLRSIDGDHLNAMTMLYAGTGTTLPPGATGIIFMDVSFAADDPLPQSVAARITATRQGVGPDGKPRPLSAGSWVPTTFTFTGAATPVGKAARVIDSPLRGSGWVAGDGCCDRITQHREGIITVNGVIQAPQRFAIDWVQIDGQNRLFEGDKEKLASWHYYGAPIHSVADGTVVNLYDGADEQIPGPHPTGITTENIVGLS